MAAVDSSAVAAFLSVEPPTITQALESPTADLVATILNAIAAKSRQYEETEAEKLRLEVKLESAVRTNDSKLKAANATVQKAVSENAELQQKLKQVDDSKVAAENQLQVIKSGQSGINAENETLRNRIATLESSNRETLAALEQKATAHDRVSEELSLQQQKNLELRREIASIEQASQNAASGVSSAKFREQTLQQELDMAKRSNEWYENELKTKNAEYLKFRKEKGARISELQRENEDLTSNVESMKRTENTLRTHIAELESKVEETLQKSQQLQNQAIAAEENYRQELATVTRLAELHEESAKSAKNRVKDLESLIERLREAESDEIGKIQAELEKERREKEAAEQRVGQLEDQVERLENDASQGRHINGLNGNATPTRPSSVLGRSFGLSPSSSSLKGSLSMTQLYSDLSSAQSELAAEQRRNAKLEAAVDEMIQDLEAKEPEIREMKAEHDRLQGEISDLSGMLEEVQQELQKTQKDSQVWEGQAAGLQTERNVLRQQLRDLSAQIRLLMTDIEARDAGLPGISPAEREELERLARQDLDDEDMSEVDRIVSERFVLFKNVKELQAQNVNLLQASRELGQQLKVLEDQASQSQEARQSEEIDQLNKRIERYKDEIKALVTRSESYIQERDTMRRMLQRRGQVGDDGQPGTPLNRSIQSVDTDYIGHLKELQSHFDAYREEASTDRKILKEQVDKLAKERNELQGQFARAESQVSLSTQRYQMLESNFAMLKTENAELQKRGQTLAEGAAKQDIRTQQVAEDLVEAKSMAETLRTENANLKAEKTVWKSRETRLSEENSGLSAEKQQMNAIISNLQSLANERERSDSEARRRLQSQTESLESELQSTKKRLETEVEDGKKLALRKEYEVQQAQKRIDDLMASLSNTREELIAAKTAKDHLQPRVDELTIELRAAEERFTALQPRLTARSSAQAAPLEEESNREEELALELADIRKSLELTKSDLESARKNEEQYKAISQAAEEELNSMNETHSAYREEMEKIVEEKESRIKELVQRIEDISSELSETNSELSKLRDSQGERDRQAEEGRALLEAEISRLREEDEKHATNAQFHQEDLRAQAAIAQEAQTNYERELVKHAEAAQALQTIRQEHNTLRMEVAGLRTEAESAKATLAQSETSWEETKETFNRELTEMRARRDDLNSQNRLLHQQLESVNSQVSNLRQDQSFESSEDGEGVQEIIKYLRREKEIVDVQWELSIQETKRIKQQLEYTQTQLDETRLKLEQERRGHDDGRNSTAHKDLMEKLNELNLFRESSITLRNEARQAQDQLALANAKIDELTAKVSPLEVKAQEAEADKELAQGEIKLLQEDRDRWQQRMQDILQKYDRVDPAEMEALKEKLTSLEQELSTEKEKTQPLQAQVDGFEERLKNAIAEAEAPLRLKNERFVEQSRQKVREMRDQIRDKTVELQTAVDAKTALETELASVKTQLEAAMVKDVPMTDAVEAVEAVDLQPQVNELAAEVSHLRAQIAEKDATILDLRSEIETIKAAKVAPAAAAAAPAESSESSEALQKLQSDLADAQKEVEILRQGTGTDIATLQAELDARHDARMKDLEERMSLRSKQMRDQLNTKLIEGRKAFKDEVQKEHEAAVAALEAKYQAELAAIRDPTVIPSSQAEEVKPQAPPATPTVSSPGGALPELSDAQVRQLIASNTTVKAIITNNLKNRIEKEREVLTTKFSAEREAAVQAKLAEAEAGYQVKTEELKKVADAQREQEVSLASKRLDVKINMAQSQARNLKAKFDVVEKAAKETPQKPVIEVYEVANAAKAPPPAKVEPPKAVGNSAIPQPASLSQPTAASSIPQPGPTAPQALPMQTEAPTGLAAPPQRLSLIPPPSSGAAVQNAIQSGIARGRGQPGRGQSQLPRGRGRGRGQPGQMNPGATQFVPGNKRPREGEDGDGGVKRPRGGGVAGS
jgi:nucleoprotein TPR